MVEKPLISYIMGISKGNQSKAAEILGLNRNTLRKKLKQHKIDI
jgi:Fis family transcriptional regulator